MATLTRFMVVALSADASRRLERTCARLGVDEADFCADAIETALLSAAERPAKRRPSVDEPLLARLRALVAVALREASSWPQLRLRLAADDLALAPAGGGLELRQVSSGARLCKASDVGPSYSALIRRFGAPYPNHPHAWVANKVLGSSTAPRSSVGVPSAKKARLDDETLIDWRRESRTDETGADAASEPSPPHADIP